MKFWVVLCLLAVASAEEDSNQDTKSQSTDSTQSSNVGLGQSTGSFLNSQPFPSTFNVFDTKNSIAGLPYTGFTGNVSPLQGINPDFFGVSPAVINGVIPTFPVTRAVLPGTSGVVNGFQTGFPVTGGVLASVPTVHGITTQFPTVGSGVLSTGVPAYTTGALGTTSGVGEKTISSIPTGAFRFVSQQGLTGFPQQVTQSVVPGGFTGVPTFTNGILSPVAGGVLTSGQGLSSGVLKNPTGTVSGISTSVPNLSTGNFSSGQLNNVFRHTRRA